jgi:isocitrate/isopropylmalate dehydrogenase
MNLKAVLAGDGIGPVVRLKKLNAAASMAALACFWWRWNSKYKLKFVLNTDAVLFGTVGEKPYGDNRHKSASVLRKRTGAFC